MNPAEMAANSLKRVCNLPRLIRAALSVVLLLGLMVPSAPASIDSSQAKSSVTLEEYEAELERFSTAASKLPDDPAGIDALRKKLPSGWVVTKDSTRFEVSAEWLAGSLKNIFDGFLTWNRECAAWPDQAQVACIENNTQEFLKGLRKECEESGDQLKKLCNEKGDKEILLALRKQCEESGGKPKTLCAEAQMLENLSAWKAECDELASQLKQMRSEAESLAGAAQASDESGARAKLNHILSGREFQGMKSGETWLGRMWDQVQRWVSWILQNTIGRLLDSGPARKLVLWLLIGGVFLIIAVWVVRILTRMSRTEALRVDGAFPPGRNWRQWTQEALAAARAGDYRTALHAAYWAGVYRLADSGAWKLDRARTPREYLRLLRNPPGRQANLSPAEPAAEAGRVSALAALTRSMESAWYGYNPATQQDFDSAVDQLETLGCKLRSTAQTANS